jgi:hypothetical protein
MTWKTSPSDADGPVTLPIGVDKIVALHPFPDSLSHQACVRYLGMMKNDRELLVVGPADIVCVSYTLPDQSGKSGQKSRIFGLVDFNGQDGEVIGVSHGPPAFGLQEKSEKIAG